MKRSVWRVVIAAGVVAWAGGVGAGVHAVGAAAVSAARADIAGRWEGSVELPGTALAFDVDFSSGAEGLTGDISIPVQNAKDMKLDGVGLAGDEVTFVIAGVPGAPTFKGKVSPDGGTISGEFTQGGVRAPFTMKRAADPAKAAREVLAEFDEWLEGARASWKVPGIAVAIVKGGEVVFAGGAGTRDVEGKLPMTADTLLAIGSSTKAFTTTVLATLVEEGKLDWDAPVRTYMPDFAIKDEDAAREMTTVDLVTHRSGMPRHDLVWYNSTLTRDEIFSRLRHLPSSAGMRAEFQYNNLMYLAAGVLIERLTGETWEEAVRERIFDRTGMRRSVFGPSEAQKDADHAQPYREEDDVVKRIRFREIRSMGPAGNIYSSANEMSRWVLANLGRKGDAGGKLVGASVLAELHSPHMHIGGPASPAAQQVVTVGYGLGWFIDVYRGHRRVHHGGNIDGFSALVVLFPDDDAGVVVLTNMDASALPGLVARHGADLVLGMEAVDWNGQALAERAAAKATVEEADAKKATARKEGTRTAHALADYAGAYEHPGYGVIDVTRTGEALSITFNRLTAPLEHWHYEVFNCLKNPEEPLLKDIKVQFITSLEGEVEALRVGMDPTVDPAVFQRRPDAQLTDPEYLARLAGAYQLGSQEITCEVRGDRLWTVVSGQPAYELEPRRNNTFQLKGMAGFSVRFDVAESGEVKSATFIQPNGVFTATRK